MVDIRAKGIIDALQWNGKLLSQDNNSYSLTLAFFKMLNLIKDETTFSALESMRLIPFAFEIAEENGNAIQDEGHFLTCASKYP
jgi:hypothetical protein